MQEVAHSTDPAGQAQRLVGATCWPKCPSELARIAERGFEVLNAREEDELVTRLTSGAFASPHLMQVFCLQLCKYNGLRQSSEETIALRAADWGQFFRSRGSATSKTAFDLLARGPRKRSDRKARQLTTGDTTDIHGAVLAAIARTGPLPALTYEQLRAALRQVLDEEPPQRHQVNRVLDKMVKIVREEIEGEPVLDYDLELSTLDFISTARPHRRRQTWLRTRVLSTAPFTIEDISEWAQ